MMENGNIYQIEIIVDGEQKGDLKNEIFKIIEVCHTKEFNFDSVIPGLGYQRSFSECFEIDSNGNFIDKFDEVYGKDREKWDKGRIVLDVRGNRGGEDKPIDHVAKRTYGNLVNTYKRCEVKTTI